MSNNNKGMPCSEAGRGAPLTIRLARRGGMRASARASRAHRVPCVASSTHALKAPRRQAATRSGTGSSGIAGSRPCRWGSMADRATQWRQHGAEMRSRRSFERRSAAASKSRRSLAGTQGPAHSQPPTHLRLRLLLLFKCQHQPAVHRHKHAQPHAAECREGVAGRRLAQTKGVVRC